MSANPEIGRFVQTGDIRTNYHDQGEGSPILLLHGSGPGVSAWANWRGLIERLRGTHRLLAPDFAGFGYTEIPDGQPFSMEVWLQQAVQFMDAIGLEKASVVGNSFGGAMALALAIHHPERVDKLILMGAVGVSFPITQGLDDVWGYTPSFEAMSDLMRTTFAYDGSFITDDMVQLRYEASSRPQAEESFSRMFPAPRQRWVDAMSFTDEQLSGIPHRTLAVHGRDDQVIPLDNTLRFVQLIERADAHIFSQCGHWTQIEKIEPFARLVADFVDHE